MYYAATAPTYETREAMSPAPCKWFGAGLGHQSSSVPMPGGNPVGLLDWLASWFGGRRRYRDVSGLAEADADLTRERVDTGGGPLKPQHLRQAVRDARLLPKPQPTAGMWVPGQKKKVMSQREADRLFSATFRTCNRNLRDLTTDEEQLRRYGLPVWKSEADVARALQISEGQLRHYSIHRQRETSPHYVTFALNKRRGGHRLIHAPKRRLKQLQRTLDALLVKKLPVSTFAHGFRAGRSVASNARQHVGKAIVIKLDLQDCFPSIHFGRVRGLLVALGYSYPVSTTLAVVMTESPRQPVAAEGKIYHVPVGPRVCVQGAPTSPGLCNAVLMRLDRRLAGLAGKHGFTFTRYADDLTFAGDDPAKIKLLLTIAACIVREEGFRLNPQKTRVLRQGARQRVTGVVVNDQPGLSRTERRKLRAAIHRLDPADEAACRRIEGKLAYLQMLNPDQAAPLRSAFVAARGRG